METIKEYATGLFVLVVAFSYSIFFIVQTGLRLPSEGALFQIYSGALAVMVYLIYLYHFNNIPNKGNVKAFLICAFALLLYYSTPLFYGYKDPRYNSYFLSMGVRFIPAILMGAVMLKDESILEKIDKALMPFVILYTIILASVVFTAQIGANVVSTFNTGTLNYQTISYYSIFAFGLTMYMITYGGYSKLKKSFIIVMAFIQFLMAIMAGGRGAFALGIVFCVYFGLKMGSLKKMTLYIILALTGIGLIQYVNTDNEVFMQGFNRIFNFWGNSEAIQNDGRWIRWGLAFDAFKEYPITGHGLGSVFYEVGFYSHNIFTDLLCEGGILLTGLFLYILFEFYRYSKILMGYNHQYEIIVIIFICSFTMLCFSGYYLSESGMWLSLSYILNHKISKVMMSYE